MGMANAGLGVVMVTPVDRKAAPSGVRRCSEQEYQKIKPAWESLSSSPAAHSVDSSGLQEGLKYPLETVL